MAFQDSRTISAVSSLSRRNTSKLARAPAISAAELFSRGDLGCLSIRAKRVWLGTVASTARVLQQSKSGTTLPGPGLRTLPSPQLRNAPPIRKNRCSERQPEACVWAWRAIRPWLPLAHQQHQAVTVEVAARPGGSHLGRFSASLRVSHRLSFQRNRARWR
jgi:hypothetical protein